MNQILQRKVKDLEDDTNKKEKEKDKNIDKLKVKLREINEMVKKKDKKIEESDEKIKKLETKCEELFEEIAGKCVKIETSELKLNEILKNQKDVVTENNVLSEQMEDKNREIEELELKVWSEEEDYKNLMFVKESNDEDNWKEINKLEEEAKDNKIIIKELKDRIDKFEETIVKIGYKYICNKCDLTFKTKKQLNQHSSEEH